MRDYAKVAASFWTGDTGRQLREMGRDAQLVALYLITGPNANAIGIYDLPIPLVCYHIGMSRQETGRGLGRASEVGFCRLSPDSDEIFVPMMAFHQIGSTLAVKDNRYKWVLKLVEKHRKSRFIKEFHELYAERYHLPGLVEAKAPAKPLPSQEMKQEKEIENKSPPTPLWGEDDREPETSDSPSQRKKGPPDFRNLVPSSLAGSDRFLAAWDAFVDHRRQKRQVLTERAARGSLTRLEQMGIERAAAALEYSVAQGWTGIHEEGGRSAGRPGPGMGQSRVPMPDGKDELYRAKTRRAGAAGTPEGEGPRDPPGTAA